MSLYYLHYPLTSYHSNRGKSFPFNQYLAHYHIVSFMSYSFMGSYAYTPLMYSFMDLALLQRDHLRANNWCILINKDRRRRNHHLQGDPSWWTSSFPLVSSVHQDLEIQDLYLTYQNHTTGYHRIPSRHYHQYLYLLCLHWKSHRPKK